MKFEVVSMSKSIADCHAQALMETSEVKSKFYVGCMDESGQDHYLRNDGRVFNCMQIPDSPLDLNGGTYFNTQQDAEDCLKRYNEQVRLNKLAECN